MVAIILVNYNGAQDTIDCIKSLTAIRNTEVEIIVVDNKSSDDSLYVLSEAQRMYSFTLLKAKENKGFSAGNNIGMAYAIDKGYDYFLLLNNDTVVKQDFLKMLLKPFESDAYCGATTSKICYYSDPDMLWYDGGSFNQKLARTVHWNYGMRDAQERKTNTAVTFASGCCMCLSKALVEEIGLLDEDYFLYEEDADLCCRIISAGHRIIYVPASVIYHKVSASTGRGSPMSQYYSVRNKYMLIKKCISSRYCISAYIYSTAQMIYRCIKGELDFKWYWKGLRAFCAGSTGKDDCK